MEEQRDWEVKITITLPFINGQNLLNEAVALCDYYLSVLVMIPFLSSFSYSDHAVLVLKNNDK
jgi:hypothetical protein